MTTLDCAGTRLELGVYVLGAIDAGDRARVDQHVTGCRQCQEELAELSGLPAVLGRVSVADVSRIPGEEPAPVAACQRRRWQAMVAAAAVVIAAAGAVIGLRLASGGDAVGPPPAHWQTARVASALPGVTAAVRYSSRSWGTAVDTRLAGVPDGTTCQLWVTDARGVHWAAGGWIAAHGAVVWYPGSSWVPVRQVQGFDVTAGNRQLVAFTPR